MKCSDAEDLFSDYLEGSGDSALSVSMDNHLASCPDCRELLAGLRQVWTELDTLPVVEPPAYFHQNLMARVAASTMEEAALKVKPRPEWNWRSLFQPRQLAFAASALILILAGLEVAHTTNAAMDPVGMVDSWLFRSQTPLDLYNPRAEWKPEEQSNNILVLHLQTARGSNGQSVRARYHVQLIGADPVDIPSGIITSNREKTIEIPVRGEIAPGAKLEVSLTPAEGNSNFRHAYEIPVLSSP